LDSNGGKNDEEVEASLNARYRDAKRKPGEKDMIRNPNDSTPIIGHPKRRSLKTERKSEAPHKNKMAK